MSSSGVSSTDNLYAQLKSYTFGVATKEAPEPAPPAPEQHPLRSALKPRPSLSVTTNSTDSRRSSLSGPVAPANRNRIRALVQRIKNEAVGLTFKDLESTEQAVVREGFLAAKHVRAISIALETMNAGCSFRVAGEHTLKRIGEGAEAKGHDTLEKTLKPATVDALYSPTTAKSVWKTAEAADITGYVTTLYPDRSGMLHMGQGVARLDVSDVPAEEELIDRLGYAGTNRALPIDLKDLESLKASLQPLKDVRDWKTLPLTGDYDLHDMFSLTGRRSTVPSGSTEETAIIDAINAAISTVDPDRRPAGDRNRRLVQHGPQVNYVAFMLNEEPTSVLNQHVAAPSFPVAMYVANTGWKIVRDHTELANEYKKNGVNLKQTWTPRGSLSIPSTRQSSLSIGESDKRY